MASIPNISMSGVNAGNIANQISSTASPDLGVLITNIESELQRLVASSKEQKYSAVKVLLLKWEQCDLDPTVENETLELQSVFRDLYGFDAGYSTDVFRIPSQLSEDALDAFVSNAKLTFSQLQTSEKKLMIVYYNGHGHVDRPSNELYITGMGDGSGPIIPWNGVHELLRKSTSFDVLLLLDCCFAARALKAVSGKTMEVLCAVSREVPAGMGSTGSYFTSALIQDLKKRSNQPGSFLVSELACALHHDTSLEEQSPNYIPISGHGRPIRLRPLNQVPTAGPIPALAQQRAVSSVQYDYEDTLRKYLAPLEITDSKGHWPYQTLNCLIDSRIDSSFISANTIQRLGLQLDNDLIYSGGGVPLITKQVTENQGSTLILVKRVDGSPSTQVVFPWPGVSFSTTGEIDMILGKDLLNSTGMMASVPPLDPLLEEDLDKWDHDSLYGSGPSATEEKEKHIQQLTAISELIKNELARRQP